MPNPYAPPRSDVADIVDVARKPKSVWLMQIVAILLACMFGLGLLTGILSLVSEDSTRPFYILARCVFNVVALWALVQAIVASQKRRSRGRWLGLLLIAAVFAMFIYAGYFNLVHVRSPANASAEYRAGQSVGAFLGVALMLCACALWFRRFGFSQPARTWFGMAAGTARQAPDESQS